MSTFLSDIGSHGFSLLKRQNLRDISLCKGMIEKQFPTTLKCTLKCIQTDSGIEFKTIIHALELNGVLHKIICPHSSTKNGVVECRHKNHWKRVLFTLSIQSSFAFLGVCF